MILPARTDTEKAFLVSYVAKRMNVCASQIEYGRPVCMLAAVREDAVVGAVVYGNLSGADVELHMTGEVGWLTKGNLRTIFEYPFKELGCRRVTAWIARKNKRSRDLAERLGFKLEGVRRKGCGNGADAIMYGLLAEECRWI